MENLKLYHTIEGMLLTCFGFGPVSTNYSGLLMQHFIIQTEGKYISDSSYQILENIADSNFQSL